MGGNATERAVSQTPFSATNAVFRLRWNIFISGELCCAIHWLLPQMIAWSEGLADNRRIASTTSAPTICVGTLRPFDIKYRDAAAMKYDNGRGWIGRSWAIVVALQILSASVGSVAWAAEPDPRALGEAYQSKVRPLVEKYCGDCHGASDVVEGDINFAAIKAWDDVARQPKMWQKTAEMLGNELMPPEDVDQPTEAERAQLKKWVAEVLRLAARKHAGDPGQVVLRRLNNAEYTYTIRDVTGVASLDPAREFPVDGAAGEGFTNTGNSLVMSPALVTKYLDAAKEVAGHAVLLPDGFRFSPHTTTRDWTNDLLADIRNFYGQFTEASGGSPVNLQGIVFDTNQGGRLPVEKYLAATVAEREALAAGRMTVAAVAAERKLNAKYLGALWRSLIAKEPSLLLDELRAKWRVAKPGDEAALRAAIEAWQKALWKFNSVAHIGRVGAATRWMEAVDPLTTKQDVRFKLPESPDGKDVTITLVATDAGDGNAADFVVWQAPRLVAAGRPDLLLRDVRDVVRELKSRRERLFATAAAALAAADEISRAGEKSDVAAAARQHGCEENDLRAWLDYLGIGSGDAVKLDGLFTNKLTKISGHDFINGWGKNETPMLLANSSNEAVRIPGDAKPHGVVVHPSPTLRTTVAWRSPIAGAVKIAGTVRHAHVGCGNGVTWSLEVRRGATRQRLATGVSEGGKEVKFGPFDAVLVRAGEVISLSIGPRDGNHACDLTAVDLEITGKQGDVERSWNLATDVAGDVLAANPHGDRFGNAGVWHFLAEADSGGANGPVIPAASLLAKWQAARDSAARRELANAVQKLLTSGPPAAKDSPDGVLYRQLASLRGPLLGSMAIGPVPKSNGKDSAQAAEAIGVDPALFGRHPNGRKLEAADLCVQAPSQIEVTLPADLAAGCELVTTGVLDKATGAEGSVQLSVVTGKAAAISSLQPGDAKVSAKGGTWTASGQSVANSAPILVTEGSAAERRVKAAFDAFRQLFPPALCYTKIVPVDEVISLTLFYREDDHLVRLMLNEEQTRQLDRLWDELHFVSRDALTTVDAFAQLLEYASQDGDPKAFEPLRKPITDRAAAYRQRLVDCEPVQVGKLIDFAALAYRRPLAKKEVEELNALYKKLRGEEIPHEEAFRMMLAKILVSPAFLYRLEKPGPGVAQGPVSDWELASRLSYFLWSSQPDGELRQMAAEGRLHEPEVLAAQTRRMLADAKTRRLATEFANHWLHVDDFEHLDEKSERHFPTFAGLRGAMAEETTLFFTDLFQSNGSVLDILNANYTFLNEPLAKFYGIPDVTGAEWRRVEGAKKFARGGILAQATTLAKHSGASRTSPIIRGNWISETLLGDKLPKPPKGVPPLPDDEAALDGQTMRQVVMKHTTDPKCFNCHRRIDPFGFSLEAYDAIGRHRTMDLGNRPVDTHVKLIDGAEFDGMEGLRDYMLNQRRESFVRQFCRKLLGFSLGRAVQLSDDPLLEEMQQQLAANGYKIQVAVNAIVSSRQFREIRGADVAFEE